ncbi:hypothetical protein PFISCL1PPCAC_28936, partial [Pristionchus fissidentatus]
RMEFEELGARLGHLLDGNVEDVDVECMRQLATYVGKNEDTVEVIDRLDEEQYAELQRKLITVASEGGGSDSGKFALRLLMNIGQRSTRHSGCLSVSLLPQLRDLFMSSTHVVECAAILTMAARKLATSAALDENLDTIVAAVCHLWMSVEDDGARSWLSAFVSTMLEVDGAFLANAFGELPPTVFTMLLHIAEALSDGLVVEGRGEGEFRMHANNVQMLIDIVKRAHFDYSDEAIEGSSSGVSPPFSSRFLPEYPEQLPLLLAIIANLSVRRDLFDVVFSARDNLDVIDVIVDLLDVALHSEGDVQRAEEDRVAMEERRPDDRPQKAPAFQSPRVLSSPSLNRMASAFVNDDRRERAKERIGALKCAAVRAIGNIGSECAVSRIRAGARGAVVLCLAAARRQQHDDAFVTQWAIAALRYLCVGCPENQEILASIDSAPTGIIDRDNLLAQMGMRVVTVEDEAGPGKKKAKLAPL